MMPYSYTADEAGITGAVLIVTGLITTAIICPIVDRTHAFLLAIKVQIPIIAIGYVGLVFAIDAGGGLVLPILVVGVLGAASFSLLPLALEWVVEVTHPAPPEITSSILWGTGQLAGGVFILVMDAMKDEQDGGKMKRYTIISSAGEGVCASGLVGTDENVRVRSLIFEAAVAAAVCPLAFLLGYGKKSSGRISIDKAASEGSSVGSSAALI